MDNYAIGADHGEVAVFGRISSGGANGETRTGPRAADVATPKISTASVSVIPTPTAPDHRTRASAFIAIDVAVAFVTINQRTTPHKAASPNERYEPCGYITATAPSATERPATPKAA